MAATPREDDFRNEPKPTNVVDKEAAEDQRQRQRREMMRARERWSSGLFVCHTDCGGCVRTCCCMPCSLAETKTTFDESAWLLMLCCACWTPLAFGTLLRNEMRIGYGIRGSWPKDVCISCLCFCCSACQMAREVKYRGAVTDGAPMVQLMELERGGVDLD
eukprot:TRINITY_DN51461_c0_g1_i1.p2 TRINITY_DN51461_c0_g1~~TRINITY_DN51461_c0_g1_i1.p2  ORF type:complete len:161 (+),score=42.52 TRINITY_DN51461_c0_g1_i1:91-573(+)